MMVTLTDVLHVRCMRDAARLAMLTNLMQQPLAAIYQLKSLRFLLNDSNTSIRYAAVIALSGTGAEGVPALIEALASHQPSLVRTAAIQALMLNEHTATPAVSALGNCLWDPNAIVRDQAASALAKIGAPAYPTIRDALRSPNHAAQSAAATALGRCGPKAADLVGDLRAITWTAPKQAVPALLAAEMRLTGDTSAGKAQLVALLRDPIHEIRHSAVSAIAELGPLGLPLQDAVMGRMYDPSPLVRGEMAKAIVAMAPDSPIAQSVLSRLAIDRDPSVRGAAMVALPQLGARSKEIINEKLRNATGQDLGFARAMQYKMDELRRPPSWSRLSQNAASGPLKPLDDAIRKL